MDQTRDRDALLLAVLAHPPERRQAYLQEACGEDTELRLTVERLLREADDGDAFLPTGGAWAGPLARDLEAKAESGGEGQAGTRVGPYRILREIGRGGMGAVYLAERADDTYQKRVAVKFGARGQWSSQAERRFREERQILAGLEHVNIARLLDGGTTDRGAPFLVMEYVDGEPIDVYCDRHRLPIGARLRLFQGVCAAVQYAHQRLVVHRDIKPSNVLITAEGTPKLLDFGIAKILAEGADAPMAQTATHERMFTPLYASPEQVRGAPVTTATDVYQLGMLLFHLLTGRWPYQVATPLPHEVAAAICSQEPQRPSAAIARAELAAGAVAEGSLDRLRRRLRGDLDAIVLTALRKAPEQRYASVEQFSEDIQRHLEGRPVGARADSGLYRARRFLWRHRIASGAVAAVFVILVIALGIATWQAQVARAERARAEGQEARNRRLLYAAQMNLAGQYWTSAHTARTVELLNGQVPAAGGEDLRGFEWHYLWRVSHAALRTFEGAMLPIAVSRDGRTLASADDSETPRLHLWDVQSGRRISTFGGHGGLNALDVSPDGTTLLSGGDDQTARLWSIANGQERLVLRGHTGPVMAAQFDPTGTRIATSSHDGTAKLWDLSGRELATLGGHNGPVTAVAFSSNGRLLATAGEDSTARLWDVTSYRQTALFTDRRPGPMTAVVFSADDRYLATTGVSMGGLAVWDLSTRQLLPINYTASEFTAAFAPDGELLAFGGHDRLVVVVNVRAQRFVRTIRGHGDAVDAVRFLPDGRHLVSASRDGSTRLWSLDVPQGPTVIPCAPRAVEFSPDGRWLAIATEKTVRLLDAATEREAALMPIPANAVGLAFAPDSRTLAAIDVTGSVHVLSVPDGTATKVLPAASPLDMTIRSATVAFSPDGRQLAAADGDGNIRLWAVGTWEHRLLEARAGVVAAVAFSPDGRLLAIAGPGLRSAQIHDLARQRPPMLLTGHTRGTVWIGFTADGSQAITTSFDGTVRLWDPSTGRETAKIVRGGDLSPAVLTPDQRRLIVGGLGDSSLAIFDTDTNDLLLTLGGHTGPISDIAVSPDGTIIASSSNDRSVRIWRAGR